MTSPDATAANAEQIHYWNEVAAPKWLALQQKIDAQLRPLGLEAMDRARVGAGERVVDVGCGAGDTTIELARRVGGSGGVLGVDVCSPLLERTAERVRAAGLDNVRLENADAQTYALPAGQYDLVFSRFGVMFFADPAAAFANLRKGLRPGGRLAFVCWQALARNAWVAVPLAAASRIVALPPPVAAEAPGPFAFADIQRVHRILEGAGFVDLGVDELVQPLTIGGGGDVADAVELLLQIGPLAGVLREVDPQVRSHVAVVVRAALVPYQSNAGLEMQAAAWVVTAHK
jgi:SAM-dependent methyltransferase